jgi:hypothetical protein
MIQKLKEHNLFKEAIQYSLLLPPASFGLINSGKSILVVLFFDSEKIKNKLC